MASRFQPLMATIASGQIDQLLFRELLRACFVDFVRHMAFGDERDRLDPGERRAFALGEHRRFAPGVEQMHPLVGLAVLAGFVGVHDEADRRSR